MYVPLGQVKLMEKRETRFNTLAINSHTAEQKNPYRSERKIDHNVQASHLQPNKASAVFLQPNQLF